MKVRLSQPRHMHCAPMMPRHKRVQTSMPDDVQWNEKSGTARSEGAYKRSKRAKRTGQTTAVIISYWTR